MRRHADWSRKNLCREQPDWICWECGERWRAGEWFGVCTWHHGVCDVCGRFAIVTEPRDCGYLRNGWQGKQEAEAVEIS